MKKTMLVWALMALGALPLAAWAGGEHAGGHEDHGDHGRAMERAHQAMGADHHGMASPDPAVGRPGNPAKVDRTVTVVMGDDMRFAPSQITVKAGETVRFFVRNSGKVAHEMVLGSLKELRAHAEEMRKMPGMKHAEPNMVTLGAGKRGGMVWQFTEAGTVDFACLVPGHFEAGMHGTIRVE